MLEAKNYPRRLRVASLLRDGLARELTRQGAGFATVRDVELSADYAVARVYYTLLADGDGARQNAADWFQNNADRLRRRLASSLQMRHTPRLIFLLDESAERAERLARFLDAVPAAEK